jgi:riboflavin biosynthesis pyrimidine reductase
MNAKQVIALLAVALAGKFAMAAEAEQFNPAPSTLSRAEVKADLARARQEGAVVSSGEATVFVDHPVAAARSREDVRAEARIAARNHAFNPLYIGA